MARTGVIRSARLVRSQESEGLLLDAHIVKGCLQRLGIVCSLGSTDAEDDRSPHVDLNVFIESISPQWVARATWNAFIPNCEWLRPETVQELHHVDLAFTKSHAATAVIRELGLQVAYIGFTTGDRYLPRVEKDWQAVLHVAGKSTHKGTTSLVGCWTQHRAWPTLTVVYRTPVDLTESGASNLRLLQGFLPDAELQYLQNHSGIHVAVSEAEGYGHTIAEAMSTGAVVVSTNAPPMNEILSNDCGVLVATKGSAACRLGTRYAIDLENLSDELTTVFSMSADEKSTMGLSARRKFVELDLEFDSRMKSALTTLEGGSK